MQVLVTGGGTAGHVTPLVALAAEIRQQLPVASIVFVGFKGDKDLHKTVISEGDFNRRYTISAGKLRRYYGVSLWRQLLDIPTVVQNIWDIGRIIRGTFASVRILRRERPDIVFAKGGFVSVPVAVAAKITNVPLVTHDSDTVAGLANRITARWATVIATGAPTKHYSYDPAKMVEVGIPVDADVITISKTDAGKLRQELGISPQKPLVTIVGGTHGGKEVNEAVLRILPEILQFSGVVHIAGASNIKSVRSAVADIDSADYRLERLVPHEMLMKYFKASDVVVTRVGASTMAELSLLGVPTILVPNPKLTGGHQLKNAERFAKKDAAIVLDQQSLIDDPNKLLLALRNLLNDSEQRRRLAKGLRSLARPDATEDLARIIISSAQERGSRGVA